MSKIMLVLDNDEDENFLEKILSRLRYKVIAMRHGVDLSEQLIDHFPDVVFAATLGKNARTLSALGKIKEMRGKPKLVFVKQEKESSALNEEQKRIIDGVLYSPIDPFKLIDVLAHTTDVDITELRRRYNEFIELDRQSKNKGNQYLKGSCDNSIGKTYISGGDSSSRDSGEKIPIKSPVSQNPRPEESEFKAVVGNEDVEVSKEAKKDSKKKDSVLIDDPVRSKKYDQYLKTVERPEEAPLVMDGAAVRGQQKRQAEQVHEGEEVKKNRKHFLKTLFSTSIDDVSKKSS